MSSTLTIPVDFYLLLIPAFFGFVFAFVLGLGIYQCATFARVKGTYKKRNRVLESRLAHSLAYCDAHDVTSVYDTLREWGYDDLCDGAAGSSRGTQSRSTHDTRSSSSSAGSRDSHSRRGGHGRSASHRHYPTEQHQQRNGGSRSSSSFVLDEVSMLDSDEYSDES